jgi:hypothetical protein
MLESVSITSDSNAWHKIDVIHHGEGIEVLFDDESRISVEDNQLDFKGWIGLWAQGSAMPTFDDVNFYTDDDEE